MVISTHICYNTQIKIIHCWSECKIIIDVQRNGWTDIRSSSSRNVFFLPRIPPCVCLSHVYPGTQAVLIHWSTSICFRCYHIYHLIISKSYDTYGLSWRFLPYWYTYVRAWSTTVGITRPHPIASHWWVRRLNPIWDGVESMAATNTTKLPPSIQHRPTPRASWLSTISSTDHEPHGCLPSPTQTTSLVAACTKPN